MSDDRRVVPDGEFAGIIMEWMKKQIGDSKNRTVIFYKDDGVTSLAELKLL